MSLSSVARVIVTFASLLFVGLALAIWIAPEQAGHTLGIEAIRGAGTAAMRADLGGLFAGMALLCGAAAWTRHRPWIYSAASLLAAIVLGRSIGWISNRALGGDIGELAIELTVLAGLMGLARTRRAAPATETHRRWRPILIAAAVLALGTLGGAAAFSPDVQQRIFDRAAEQRAGAVNNAPLEDNALRIGVCGSSAPLASARRAKACVAVFAGGKFYVVDVGPESVENLVTWGIPLSSIGGVLLTHFHSDHIGDLGELNLQSWAAGRPAPLDVYGGPGVEQVVDGFNRAYTLDQGYRTAHHGERVMAPSTWPMVPHAIDLAGAETPAKDRTAVVLENDGLRVTAIEVNHAPIAPAYAYRFDFKGRSVVVTGDLKFHPPLVKAADGVDVLVSEAIAVQMTRALGKGASAGGRDRAAAIMHDIEDYHITPEQAARIANDAHARLLVFYHLLPAPDNFLARRLFAQGLDHVRQGDWTLADDGSLYTLPIGSSDVRFGSLSE